jgi:large repetitive protein
MTGQNSSPLFLATVTLFLATVTILIIFSCWFLLGNNAGETILEEQADGAAGAAAASATPDGNASIPPGSGVSAETGEEDAAERLPVTPAGEGQHTISGRLVLADGTPPPRGVELSLAHLSPPFTFLSIQQMERRKTLCITKEKQLDDIRSLRRVFSDGGGRFHFENLTPGTYRVIPLDPFYHLDRSRGLTAGPTATASRPPADTESRPPVDLILREGGALDGIVRNSRGEPLAGAAVTLRERFDVLIAFSSKKGMRSPFTARSAGDGTFRFNGVPCGVSFLLDISCEGQASVVGEPVSLIKGTRQFIEIAMPEGAAISGLVQDEKGSPAPGKKVRLVKSDDILASTTSMDGKNETVIPSGKDGTFRFGNLMAGTYRVMVNEKGLVRTGHRKIKLAAGEERKDLVLVLKRGLSLAGRVVSSKGEPVAGALVKAVPEFDLMNLLDTIDNASFLTANATDEEGRFCCTGLATGIYDLEIVRRGIKDTSHKGFEAGKTDLLITLEWGGIAGIAVSTIDGEPVTDYRITLEPQGMKSLLDPYGLKSKIKRRIEDEQGKFEIIPLKPGSYMMTVKAEGFGRHRIRNVCVEDGETARGIIVMLSGEASVSGVVFDAETKEPLEGARISLKTGIEGMIAEFVGSDVSLSDEAGRYTFGGLSSGPVRLFVSHGDYETRPLDELHLSDGEKIEGFDAALTKGAVVRGHVYGSDRTPVEGANIMVSSPLGTSLKSTRTDREGFYELSGFAPGSYTVLRMAMKIDMDEDFIQSMTSGFDIRPVSLEKDEIREIDFFVDGGGEAGAISGRVTEAGSPVSKALISLLPVNGGDGAMPTMTATTDSDGHYSFRKVDPGDYTFRVVRTENLAIGGGTESVFRTTIPDSDTFEFDMELPGAAIEGSVTDGDTFRYLPSIRILIRRSEGSESNDPLSRAMAGRVGEVYTDRDGRFRIGNLKPGSYDLIAGGSNMMGIDSGGFARQRVEGVVVGKDQVVRGVAIRLERGGSIEGVLTGKRGAPAANASVFFQPEREGKFDTFSECYSDGGGKFRYTGLAPGRYTLAIKHPSYALTLVYDVVVRKDATRTVNLTLGKGAEILVSVRDESTREYISGARIELVDPAGNRLTGLLGLDDIMGLFYSSGGTAGGPRSIGRYAPGTYYVTASHSDYGTKQLEFEITAGDSSLTFTISL